MIGRISRDARPARRGAGGFSLLEALVALAIFAVVVGVVLSLFSDVARTSRTESAGLDTQESARIALDELGRIVQQAGYNIDRSDPYNRTKWQRSVVYAGSHVFAFNADIDTKIGAADSSVSFTFPGSQTYAGQAASASTSGAETYVYTIDADGDNAITLADRTGTVTGGYNPAADTENPLDFALFRRVYGYNGSNFGGTLVPVSPYLFTNATSAVQYPDGTTPAPLFTYWLTEDLNADGILDNSECVVVPCPPTSTRAPQLYLWGDTDFNGTLSETEKNALRDYWIGSPAWSRNPFVSGGVYKSSTLTAAVSPGGVDAYILKVADASKFAVGQQIRVGSGSGAETFVIDSVVTASNTISLSSDPTKAQSAGATVVVLPETLLAAIRTVEINYDAITPSKDSSGGAAAAGRAGHRGTKGLDYRVVSLRKSIELINLQTGALIGSVNTSPPPTCPLSIAGECGGSPISTMRAFFPASAGTTLHFVVKDADGNLKKDVSVVFTQSNPSAGVIVTKTVKTDAAGEAITDYVPNGVLANDTVTATVTCVNASQQLVDYTATITVRPTQVNLSLTNDCLSTHNAQVSKPSANYTLSVQDSLGTVANAGVTLGIAFDTNYLPPDPDFSTVEGELFINTTSQGTTDTQGNFADVTTTTGGSGILTGRVALNKDTTGAGTRLALNVTPAGSCGSSGVTTTRNVTFYSLTMNSETPTTGCTEIAPCTIPSGSLPPRTAALLRINGQVVPNATVNFTKSDIHSGSPAGTSTLIPGAAVVTDGSGLAKVSVGNNGASSITSANPLKTVVGATSAGDPAACSSGNVLLGTVRTQYNFEGFAGECTSDMQQPWLVKIAKDKLCTHLRNANSSGGCPLRPTAMAVTVFQTDGTTPDTSYKIDKIEGGAISTTTGCSTSGKVVLFEKACNANLALNNGQRWDFASIAGKCFLPPAAANPSEYFVVSLIDLTKDVTGTGRRIDITTWFQCEGYCPSGMTVQKTFSLAAPP